MLVLVEAAASNIYNLQMVLLVGFLVEPSVTQAQSYLELYIVFIYISE